MNGAKSTVGAYLERLYRRYDKKFLASDPVQFPHAYRDPHDQEIVAFLAALFAFGNVTSIVKTIHRIVAPLGKAPSAALATDPPTGADGQRYRHFVHRWVTRADLLAVLSGMRRCLAEWGSLRACFLAGYDPRASDVREAMSTFSRRLQAAIARESLGLRFLFNDPLRGAACKRLNMFLRWMVRPSDGVDLGLWPEVSPAQLVIPVDTHIARIGRFLGLTQRRTVNWAMAREITDRLAQCDPRDPVKYDFALTRIGIVEGCRGYRHPLVCPRCPITAICQAPSKSLANCVREVT